MTRRQPGARDAGIDRRTHARCIANMRVQQRLDALPASRMAARLAWLKQLAATVQADGFTEQERLDAEAALVHATPTSPQATLPL